MTLYIVCIMCQMQNAFGINDLLIYQLTAR